MATTIRISVDEDHVSTEHLFDQLETDDTISKNTDDPNSSDHSYASDDSDAKTITTLASYVSDVASDTVSAARTSDTDRKSTSERDEPDLEQDNDNFVVLDTRGMSKSTTQTLTLPRAKSHRMRNEHKSVNMTIGLSNADPEYEHGLEPEHKPEHEPEHKPEHEPEPEEGKFGNVELHKHSKANSYMVKSTDPMLLFKWAKQIRKSVPTDNPYLDFCVHCNVTKDERKIVYCSMCYRQTCELCAGRYILPEKHGMAVIPLMEKERSSFIDLAKIDEEIEENRPKTGPLRFSIGSMRGKSPSHDNKWEYACIPCRDECMLIRQRKTSREVIFRPGRVFEEKDGFLTIYIPEWDPISEKESCFECSVSKLQDFAKSAGNRISASVNAMDITTLHNCRICGHIFCGAKCSLKLHLKIPHNFLQKGKQGATRICLECRFLLMQDNVRLDGGLGPQKPAIMETLTSTDYGRIRNASGFLSQNTFLMQEKYTVLMRLRRLGFVALFLVDTVSDIIVARQLDNGVDDWWFGLTIFFIFAPYLCALIMLFEPFLINLNHNVRKKHTRALYYFYIFLYLMFGMPLMMLYDIFFIVLANILTVGIYQANEIGRLYEITRCGITEAVGESLPLVCLNIYIFVKVKTEADEYKIHEGTIILAILSSILSIAKAIFFMRKYVFYMKSSPRIRKMVVKIREDSPLDSDSFKSKVLDKFDKIQVEEIWSLTTAIKFNHSIKTLELSNTLFDHSLEASKALAEMLCMNRTITQADFSYNEFTDACASVLAEALTVNATLINIDLRCNLIGDEGAQLIGEALLRNKSLEVLDLRSNKIGDSGGRALAQALQQNANITHIIVSGNLIGNTTAADLQRTAAHKDLPRIVEV